jgi:ABC-type antimicrobial peptide transport system permease subunit
VPAVKRAMRAADPDHALLMTTTLRQHMRDALYQDWLQAVLSAVVAAIGVALAAVGLMGIVTHAVTRRRREIGVRTALGARRSDVVGLVLRDTLVWSGAGALAGVGASLALGRAMSGLLFGVSPFDPAVLSAAVGLVLIVALCGSAYPAWRAARVDPVEVLRED